MTAAQLKTDMPVMMATTVVRIRMPGAQRMYSIFIFDMNTCIGSSGIDCKIQMVFPSRDMEGMV